MIALPFRLLRSDASRGSRSRRGTAWNRCFGPRSWRSVSFSSRALWAPLPAGAADHFVNTVDDLGDNSHGDGLCWTGPLGLGRPCSASGNARCERRSRRPTPRPARIRSHFWSGLDVNVFGTIVLSVSAPLPIITDRLTIDGTSAPTYDASAPRPDPGHRPRRWTPRGRLRQRSVARRERGPEPDSWSRDHPLPQIRDPPERGGRGHDPVEAHRPRPGLRRPRKRRRGHLRRRDLGRHDDREDLRQPERVRRRRQRHLRKRRERHPGRRHLRPDCRQQDRDRPFRQRLGQWRR